MKLHILSDLHLEFGDFVLPETDADVLILAGDIGIGADGIQWATAQTDKPVIYVAGNHEYYNREYIETLDEMYRAAKDRGVHFLENDELVFGGVRFLGCTLWTDFAIYPPMSPAMAMTHARQRLNDFRLIQNGKRLFTPEDSLQLHEESIAWLRQRLAVPFDGPTVVITHHAPSLKADHPQYGLNPLTPCFVSNLEHLMEGSRAALWIFGHTHSCHDIMVNGTRLISNQRGYVRHEEVVGFRDDLVVSTGE